MFLHMVNSVRKNWQFEENMLLRLNMLSCVLYVKYLSSRYCGRRGFQPKSNFEKNTSQVFVCAFK